MLRKYTYLLALAQQRHFGRAAATCNVSQPTLSNAIRQLEDDLNVTIVERGQKFQGFTVEGHKILEHARRMLSEQEALVQSLKTSDLGLGGVVKIGVIPTALPSDGHLLGPFSERHPKVRFIIRSMSSREIQRGLNEYELDAGITYIDNEPLVGVRTMPMYSESYFLFTRRTAEVEGLTSITWEDAAQFSLCLLTPDMQNRRIADAAFQIAGVSIVPEVETNSLMNLYTLVRQGRWSSIVTSQLLTLVKPDPKLIALPLTHPIAHHVVGLVYADRDPPSALAAALADMASSLKLTTVIAEHTRAALKGGNIVPE